MRPWRLACLEQESFGRGGLPVLSRSFWPWRPACLEQEFWPWRPDWSVICPIPCGIVFGYFGDKIDENDYERIHMVMRCGVGWWQRNYANRAQKHFSLKQQLGEKERKKFGQSETSACTMSAYAARTTYMLGSGNSGH